MRVEIVDLPSPCSVVDIAGEVVLLLSRDVPAQVTAALCRILAPLRGCRIDNAIVAEDLADSA